MPFHNGCNRRFIMHRSGTSAYNDLGPARWVKIRTPEGGPQWVTQSPSHVRSDQITGSHQVTSAAAVAGHSHSEGKVEARPESPRAHPPLSFSVKSPTGDIIKLELPPSACISDVKKHIHTKLQKPPEQQRLVLNGKQLQDSRTLSHYNIQSNATLILELPSELAIGDVFCIVLHALGNGDPIVSAHMTCFHFFCAV